MGQFDNPRSIAVLFLGAFLVSLGVITFLNIEIQSRINNGPRIRNENMFEVLGRKIYQIISSLKERNSYRRSVLYQILILGNSTRSSMRKLQFVPEDLNSVHRIPEEIYNQTFHRLRHEKKMRRLTEMQIKQKLNSSLREVKLERNDIANGSNFSLVVNNINNRTVEWLKYFSNSTKNASATDLLKEKFTAHRNCYTTNDVLEIIAMTCLVNFIFWFVIIYCVNIFTRNQKVWKSESCESLTSIESNAEYELNQNESKREKESPSRGSINRHNVVLEYVNSLKEEAETESQGNEPKAFFLPKPDIIRKSSQRRINSERWKHQRFIHFPNIFDMISLDNIKPINEKKFVSRQKNKKIVSSLSMEDLIF